MKTKLIIPALIFCSAGFAQTTWTVDKTHSDIGFTITHMMISEVDGRFNEFDAKVISNSDDFTGSKVEFTAQVSSINTNNERRDGHLKGDDFFGAEAYPEIRFKGEIKKEGESYYLEGDFTMKGVTKRERFDVKYNGQVPGGRGRKAGFKVTGTIDRFEYGLTWNRTIESGGLVVSREVGITCNVQLNEEVR
ncbi:MAG: YceI family protein [Bacteroidales bacterium]|nr:MAG: YceI family protein [Bacteroidales bacterium]